MWTKIVRLVCGLIILSAFCLATPIKSDDLFDKIKLELESLSQPITTTVKPALPEVPSSTASSLENDPQSNRRVITYDQRQDGKYNIRADLENFVILVVPPNPSSGAALLDMFTRPNFKNSPKKNPSKKYQKPQKEKVSDDQKANLAETVNDQPKTGDPFIEGRTPYHVDISGLESDAIVVGRSQLPLQSQINQFPVSVTPLRNAKAIIDSTSNQLRSNSVVAILTKPNKINTDRKSQHHNNNNKDDNDDDDDNDHDLTDPQNSFDSLNLDNVDTIDRLAVQSQVNDGTDGWELTLLGAQEQCGPDRKRDSYGICQFLPQDYR